MLFSIRSKMRLTTAWLIASAMVFVSAPGRADDNGVAAALSVDPLGIRAVHIVLGNPDSFERFVSLRIDFEGGLQRPAGQCELLESAANGAPLVRETASAGMLVPPRGKAHRVFPIDSRRLSRCQFAYESQWSGEPIAAGTIRVLPPGARKSIGVSATQVQAVRVLVEEDTFPGQLLVHALLRTDKLGTSWFMARLEAVTCRGVQIDTASSLRDALGRELFSNSTWQPLTPGWTGAVFLVRLPSEMAASDCTASVLVRRSTGRSVPRDWRIERSLFPAGRFSVFTATHGDE